MPHRRSASRVDGGALSITRRFRSRLGWALGVAGALALPTVTAGAQKLQFRQLTPDQGLSSSLVSSLVQDSHGFIWLGTKKGVNRYDGHSFAVYRHRADDSTSLADNEVFTVYEDGQKVLWVGTPMGLSRYDRDRDEFRNYALVQGDTIAVSAIT